MAEEIKDATMDLWFRERCRCEVCGAVATLGDLETCESCTDPVWRHECPVDGETYIEHQIEHHRNQLQQHLQSLQAAVRAEVERLKDWRNEPAETRRINAVYLRLEALLQEEKPDA